jgi:hypothetical protein
MTGAIGHGPPGTRGREGWARKRRFALRREHPWLTDLDRQIGGQAFRIACWVLDPRLPVPLEHHRRAFGLTMGVLEPDDDERQRWASAAAYARATGDPAGLLGMARWAPLWPKAWAAISRTLWAAGCAGWRTEPSQRVMRHYRRRAQPHPS